jgi:hypothetical protein
MFGRLILAVVTFFVAANAAVAQVVRVGDLNTRQIRALDRSKTVVSYLRKLPLYRDWISSAEERDRRLGDTQRNWLAARPRE